MRPVKYPPGGMPCGETRGSMSLVELLTILPLVSAIPFAVKLRLIYGPTGESLYLHPTQLYESITMLIVSGILIYLHRKKKFDGQVLVTYAIIYGIVRFSIEFLRDDPRGVGPSGLYLGILPLGREQRKPHGNAG